MSNYFDLLFNLCLRHGHVPAQFGISYTVPLLIGSSGSYSKNLTTDDLRGIPISPSGAEGI